MMIPLANARNVTITSIFTQWNNIKVKCYSNILVFALDTKNPEELSV